MYNQELVDYTHNVHATFIPVGVFRQASCGSFISPAGQDW